MRERIDTFGPLRIGWEFDKRDVLHGMAIDRLRDAEPIHLFQAIGFLETVLKNPKLSQQARKLIGDILAVLKTRILEVMPSHRF